MSQIVKILILFSLISKSFQGNLIIGEWNCLLHGTQVFNNTINTSSLSRNPQNGAYSMKIEESEAKSSIVYGTLNLQTTFDIEALVDLVIINYERDDVKIRTSTFPLKGPQHEIFFETPFSPISDYNITVKIYQCDGVEVEEIVME